MIRLQREVREIVISEMMARRISGLAYRIDFLRLVLFDIEGRLDSLVVSSSDSVTSEDSYSSLLPMLRGVAGPGVEAAESFLVFSAPLTAKKVLVRSVSGS
jgi:hypothetical protein